MSTTTFHPADMRGLYVERPVARPGRLDAWAERVVAWSARMRPLPRRRLADMEARVDGAARDVPDLSEAALQEEVRTVSLALRRNGFAADVVARAFGLVREQAARTLGLRHYDSQLLGGWHLLQGRLVEMDTGEGKTLTATLPAAVAALAGVPVHVVSVNDYLTRRDCDTMGPLYAALGLRAAHVVEEMGPEERIPAYRADVTYVTNKQLAFDFLRDRIALASRREELRIRFEGLAHRDSVSRRLLLRGLGFAIVDEADSILIDEARTPLILSGPDDDSEQGELYAQALGLARSLEATTEYVLSLADTRAELTDRGRESVRVAAEAWGGLWSGRRRREELVGQALLVLHAFRRDDQYLVRDEKIQVIDEYTGRVMADRAWGRGIQQMIEAKEGVPLTGVREPLARISYQRFFGRYLHLAGMTGTAAEVAGELRATYDLRCVRVPPHRPSRRIDLGEHVHAARDEKWDAVVDRVVALSEEGRPVLVGTKSVAASEAVADRLTARGCAHQLLTAKQDEGEAEIVARAGESGRVTVATNMAGRGTDIPLGDGVVEQGGLAVIVTERHDAGRIDRQLAGRAGRQGDPGSVEAWLSMEDAVVETFGRGGLDRLVRVLVPLESSVGQRLAAWLVRRAQRRAESIHRRVRRDVLRADREIEDMLAFSGRGE